MQRRRPWPSCPRCSGRHPCRVSARGSGRCRAFAPRWGRSSVSSAPETSASINGGYDPCGHRQRLDRRRRPVAARGPGSGRRGRRCGRRAGVRVDRGARRYAFVQRSAGTSPALEAAGGVSAVRSRFGISTRLRMPFYLIPGDLLLASPLVLALPRDLHRHGGHRQQRRPDSLAVGVGDPLRALPVRARARTRRHLLRLRLREHDGRAGRDAGCRTARRRFQVDPLRPADPGVPALSRVRHQAEFGGADPAVCRCRRSAAARR